MKTQRVELQGSCKKGNGGWHEIDSDHIEVYFPFVRKVEIIDDLKKDTSIRVIWSF